MGKFKGILNCHSGKGREYQIHWEGRVRGATVF